MKINRYILLILFSVSCVNAFGAPVTCIQLKQYIFSYLERFEPSLFAEKPKLPKAAVKDKTKTLNENDKYIWDVTINNDMAFGGVVALDANGKEIEVFPLMVSSNHKVHSDYIYVRDLFVTGPMAVLYTAYKENRLNDVTTLKYIYSINKPKVGYFILNSNRELLKATEENFIRIKSLLDFFGMDNVKLEFNVLYQPAHGIIYEPKKLVISMPSGVSFLKGDYLITGEMYENLINYGRLLGLQEGPEESAGKDVLVNYLEQIDKLDGLNYLLRSSNGKNSPFYEF